MGENVQLNSFVETLLIDEGVEGVQPIFDLGIIKIFDGSMPALPTDADAGIMLAVQTLSNPFFAHPSPGQLDGVVPFDVTCSSNGDMKYFRVYDSSISNCLLQGTISMTSGDLIVDTTTFGVGDVLTIGGFAIGCVLIY